MHPGAPARPAARSRWLVGVVALVLVATASCGSGGGSSEGKAVKADRAAFCRSWSRFQTGTSYHPELASYRTFWDRNQTVAKLLVTYAPDKIREKVTELAEGVDSMRTALGRARSSREWSPEETKIYLKRVRFPEIAIESYVGAACQGS